MEGPRAERPAAAGQLQYGALRTANVCGLVPQLRALLATEPGTLARVVVRQRVSSRLNDVALEVSGMAGELNWEEECAD